MDHIHCRAPFRMTIGLRHVALHDQTRAVLNHRMPHEERNRACAGGLLVEARIAVGGRWSVVEAWVAFERFSPRKSTLAVRF